jgi:hypothetical protein
MRAEVGGSLLAITPSKSNQTADHLVADSPGFFIRSPAWISCFQAILRGRVFVSGVVVTVRVIREIEMSE